MAHEAERADIVRFAIAASDSGLSNGTSGNLSIRVDDGVLITPSSLDPHETAPEDICLVSLEGEVLEGTRRPSSEVPMHLAVYATTKAKAVVHTHSEYATVVSTTHTEIPAVHYNILGLGGPVRVAPYATFGSPELALNIATALEGRAGAILQNHGAITYASTLRQAYERSVLLEWLAALYWRALQVGTPRILTDDELADVAAQSNRLRYGTTR